MIKEESIDYNNLVDFLKEVITAKTTSIKKEEEKDYWEKIENNLDQILESFKRTWSKRGDWERIGEVFISDFISSICVDIEVRKMLDLGNIENSFPRAFSYCMSGKMMDNFLDSFQKLKEHLSPGMIWWVEKYLGEKVDSENILHRYHD